MDLKRLTVRKEEDALDQINDDYHAGRADFIESDANLKVKNGIDYVVIDQGEYLKLYFFNEDRLHDFFHFKVINNPNHPRRGCRMVVDPIRDESDLASIKRLLSDNPRDLLLFTLGINNGLRLSDILRLKVKDIRFLKPGSSIIIREQKTKKDNYLVCNKSTYKVLTNYLGAVQPKDEDYVFVSKKTGKPITIQHANALIKRWVKTINLKGNYGTHSLRKTFGYHQRVRFGVSWEILATRFNHASPSTTRRYLGVMDEEVNSILLNEI